MIKGRKERDEKELHQNTNKNITRAESRGQREDMEERAREHWLPLPSTVVYLPPSVPASNSNSISGMETPAVSDWSRGRRGGREETGKREKVREKPTEGKEKDRGRERERRTGKEE